MEIESIIGAIRDHYISAYRSAISSYRERFTPSAAEVLLELEKESAPIYRYYRIDLASGSVDPPDLTEVNPSTHLSFDTVEFEYDGLSVVLSPVAWNGVEFRVEPVLSEDSGIQSWALRWIDPDEGVEPDMDGLGAYIHSVTVPDQNCDATEFSVDFGTAPTSSFIELLRVLQASGARSVEVHSRTVLDS